MVGVLAILTRPGNGNEPLARQLRRAGVEAAVLPVLALLPGASRPPEPADYDLIVFVSGAAARFYFGQLRAAGWQPSWPAETLACTVGPASARALVDAGFVPPRCIVHPAPESPTHDSEALWTLLEPRLSAIRRVLIVRGETGREWLAERFEAAGMAVSRHAAYRREAVCWTVAQAGDLAARLAVAARAVCLVTSTEGVEALRANIERHAASLRQLWESVRFVTIHPRIAGHLQSCFPALAKSPAFIRLCALDDDSVFQAIRLQSLL